MQNPYDVALKQSISKAKLLAEQERLGWKESVQSSISESIETVPFGEVQ